MLSFPTYFYASYCIYQNNHYVYGHHYIMKTKLLFLLLALFTFGCKEDTSLLVEEGEETAYGLFAIKPEKAKEEALKFVYGNKPLSRSSETLTADIQTVWRTLTISPSGASSVSTRSQSDYTEYTELVPVYIISLENEGEDAGFIVTVGDERVLAFSDEGEWDLSATGDFEEVFWEQADAYIASVIEESGEDPCDTYYSVETITDNIKYVSDFRPQWGQTPSPYNDSVPACTSTTNMPAGTSFTPEIQTTACRMI
jgi:hypothetical protein